MFDEVENRIHGYSFEFLLIAKRTLIRLASIM